jgi:Holliday junction resolvase RusA-like endonuclease
MISKRFKLTVDVFNSSDRPDLDNSFKTILDCLQLCRAIKNDRLCAEIHARKFVDKLNPRIEFQISEQL